MKGKRWENDFAHPLLLIPRYATTYK